MNPLMLLRMISEVPPELKATTGVPQHMDSSMVLGKLS